MRCMGFFQVECAPCIYTKGQGEDMAIVVIYIDDALVIAPRLETVLKVKKQIGQRWKIKIVVNSLTSLASKSVETV